MSDQVCARPGLPVLEASGIGKAYGATRALEEASLRILPSRVHALLGENGAGKSTLVKILVGATTADSGSLKLDGEPVVFASVRDAFAAGIIPIYQNLSLFPHLSVRENLSAFALGSSRSLSARTALVAPEQARQWLDQVRLAVDLSAPVSSLTLGERQLLEIARGVGQRCRVLVLDEPTASLTPAETERLFGVIRHLCANGSAIVFISHKLDEVEALADDVTILRDGRTVVDAGRVSSLSRQEIVRGMIGSDVERVVMDLEEPREIAVRVRGLSLEPASQVVDLDIKAGEILGLAGLVGSGALELAAAVAGARHVASGTVAVGARIVRAGDRVRALEAGIGYVPSDRVQEGLFPFLSATENVSASILSRFSTYGLVKRQREERLVRPWLSRLKLNPFRPEKPANEFSGGNQQKLILCRGLSIDPLKLLVILEPTRGVDIGAREMIHRAIVEAAHDGVAVVLASTDLDEVLSLSHRIYSVRQGKLGPAVERGTGRDVLMGHLTGRSSP